MGRVFLIKFDQTPENQFYVCRGCQAHIAFPQWSHGGYNGDGLSGIIFDIVVNVHIFSPKDDRKVGDRKVTNLYCDQCGNLLGIKIIEHEEHDELVGDGPFILKMNKLLIWDGMEMVYADTLEPVPNE